jgi:hypothetical protein
VRAPFPSSYRAGADPPADPPKDGGLTEKDSAAERTWYPPLRTAAVLLRQLRDAAPAPIFGDLAQDALHACRAAVAGAAESIRARASLDGALFAVRHLLLLKELAGGLELAQRAEDADAPGASGGVVSGGWTGGPGCHVCGADAARQIRSRAS